MQKTAWYYHLTQGKVPAKEWLESLKDKMVRARILARIRRAEMGNFGDHKNLGEGVGELRIDHGPGYRVYYGIDGGKSLIVLLVGGDKTTQTMDIRTAKLYWNDYKQRQA